MIQEFRKFDALKGRNSELSQDFLLANAEVQRALGYLPGFLVTGLSLYDRFSAFRHARLYTDSCPLLAAGSTGRRNTRDKCRCWG
jgi:hypothetical protein